MSRARKRLPTCCYAVSPCYGVGASDADTWAGHVAAAGTPWPPQRLGVDRALPIRPSHSALDWMIGRGVLPGHRGPMFDPGVFLGASGAWSVPSLSGCLSPRRKLKPRTDPWTARGRGQESESPPGELRHGVATCGLREPLRSRKYAEKDDEGAMPVRSNTDVGTDAQHK